MKVKSLMCSLKSGSKGWVVEMAADREKNKRRPEKRLGKESTKRSKRKPSRKTITKIIATIIIFIVTSIIFFKLVSLVPGASALSQFITLGLPLLLAWLVAAGIGQNFVPTKQSLALATICLLVATPLAYYRPWERGGWSPDNGTLPDNIPPGYVAFRFVSSFTYVSSPTNEAITNVELRLPWPYIDDYENGRPCPKPVGLDNWLRKADLYMGMVQAENINEFVRSVWNIENTGLNYYLLENAVWAVNFPLPGLPYIQTGFALLKLYYGDQLEWEDNQVMGLFGGRTAAPTITAYLEDWRDHTTSQKVTVNLLDMRPGETVSIEGIFLVAEENAANVRLDDWISSGIDRVYWKPEQENAPWVSWNFNSNIEIGERFLSVLQKQVGADFVDVASQQFGRKITIGYITSLGSGLLTKLEGN